MTHADQPQYRPGVAGSGRMPVQTRRVPGWKVPGPSQPEPSEPSEPSEPQRRRLKVGSILIAVLTLVVIGEAGWLTFAHYRSDTGVQACAALRQNAKSGGLNKAMTEQQYHEWRAGFSGSRHDDLRTHGTAALDTWWRLQRGPKDFSALSDLAALTVKSAVLESACADHGVILAGAAGVPGGEATAPSVPACKDVFVPGEVIDKAKAANGCLGPNGGLQVVGIFSCAQDRVLYQVDASSGAPAGFGFSGEKYVASKEAANDPRYSTAMRRCN